MTPEEVRARSDAERAARKPLPPAVLMDALQNPVHRDIGNIRVAEAAVLAVMKEERA